MFMCRSMSGRVAGLHTACRLQKEYRFHQNKDLPFLPIMYGAEADFELLYKSERMILTEGVFDRIALKRVVKDWPVFARLSKGVSVLLTGFIKRYAKVVVLSFDNDSKGQLGADKADKKIRALDVRRLKFPFKDPAEMLEKLGEKRTKEVILNQAGVWW